MEPQDVTIAKLATNMENVVASINEMKGDIKSLEVKVETLVKEQAALMGKISALGLVFGFLGMVIGNLILRGIPSP